MRPAYSVIIFTTASGAGYGLLVWLALTAVFHGRAADGWFAASGPMSLLSFPSYLLNHTDPRKERRSWLTPPM